MKRLAASFIGGVVHECAQRSINPPHRLFNNIQLC